MALLAFCNVFCSTCRKMFSRERLVTSPAACFGATIYWTGNKAGPVYCSIGFKVGNQLAVIQLASCHPPAKFWHSPTTICSPGECKWVTPRLCQFKKDEQRATPPSLPALRYDARIQRCIQELNVCWQLLSNHSISRENGCRFAAGPLLLLFCILHLHE